MTPPFSHFSLHQHTFPPITMYSKLIHSLTITTPCSSAVKRVQLIFSDKVITPPPHAHNFHVASKSLYLPRHYLHIFRRTIYSYTSLNRLHCLPVAISTFTFLIILPQFSKFSFAISCSWMVFIFYEFFPSHLIQTCLLCIHLSLV